MKPSLWFHNELENDWNEEGRLELWDVSEWPEMKPIERYIALSGLAGFQTWKDQDSVGRGPIPRSDVAKINCYKVNTNPVFVPASQQPGIAGNFYEIFPSYVANGRGLFGVHFDANVRGTAGCIGVVNVSAWAAFEERMKGFSSMGISQLPLMIGYS